MDRNLTYAKTPSGEEATRQRTRVVQRNLRMVLLQVDGQVTVDELIAKIGNEALVVNALKELEKGGYICLAADAPSVWQQSKSRIKTPAAAPAKPQRDPNSPISAASELSGLSATSDFSGFESETVQAAPAALSNSQFSTFGKPIMPALPDAPPPAPGISEQISSKLQGVGGALQGMFKGRGKDGVSEGRDLKPLRKINLATVIPSVLAGLLLLIAAVLFLFPYGAYRGDIEQALSAALGQPVKIGQVDARFLPRPGLVLQRVQIGAEGQASIGEIFVPQLLSLGAGSTVRDAVLSKAVLNADFLAQLAGTSKALASGTGGFQLQHLTIASLTVMMGDLSLSGLNGEIVFAARGVDKFALENEPRTLRIDLQPEAGGTKVSAQGFTWRPAGEDASLVFAAFQAKGEIQKSRLVLREVDANVLNGNVVGNWSLDWSNGLAMAGEAQLTRLSARQVSTAFQAGVDVDGELSGTLRYAAGAAQWSEIWEKLDASLAMTLTRGTLNGVDLGEATRRAGGNPVRGGSTKFERIFGTLRIAGQTVSSSDLDLDAGLLQARGQFVARRDKTVEASLQVQIKSSVQPLRANAQVRGTLPVLETTASK